MGDNHEDITWLLVTDTGIHEYIIISTWTTYSEKLMLRKFHFHTYLAGEQTRNFQPHNFWVLTVTKFYIEKNNILSFK